MKQKYLQLQKARQARKLKIQKKRQRIKKPKVDQPKQLEKNQQSKEQVVKMNKYEGMSKSTYYRKKKQAQKANLQAQIVRNKQRMQKDLLQISEFEQFKKDMAAIVLDGAFQYLRHVINSMQKISKNYCRDSKNMLYYHLMDLINTITKFNICKTSLAEIESYRLQMPQSYRILYKFKQSWNFPWDLLDNPVQFKHHFNNKIKSVTKNSWANAVSGINYLKSKGAIGGKKFQSEKKKYPIKQHIPQRQLQQLIHILLFSKKQQFKRLGISLFFIYTNMISPKDYHHLKIPVNYKGQNLTFLQHKNKRPKKINVTRQLLKMIKFYGDNYQINSRKQVNLLLKQAFEGKHSAYCIKNNKMLEMQQLKKTLLAQQVGIQTSSVKLYLQGQTFAMQFQGDLFQRRDIKNLYWADIFQYNYVFFDCQIQHLQRQITPTIQNCLDEEKEEYQEREVEQDEDDEDEEDQEDEQDQDQEEFLEDQKEDDHQISEQDEDEQYKL